jgi:MbtH protein
VIVDASPNQSPEPEYRVVVNGEEQYSIWLALRPLPLGWSDAAKMGTKAECLDFIRETWTDMRPRSVRDG